jgi:uroporphyrinogen-III decarboxylase
MRPEIRSECGAVAAGNASTALFSHASVGSVTGSPALVQLGLARGTAQIFRQHNNWQAIPTCKRLPATIPDFIDIGIDALNPVQVTAKNMQPERLKREFGERICFWGGIDSQHTLPRGTPGEVRAEVGRMSELMGANGGYVLAAVHNIQPDVPPENVCALFGAELNTCGSRA